MPMKWAIWGIFGRRWGCEEGINFLNSILRGESSEVDDPDLAARGLTLRSALVQNAVLHVRGICEECYSEYMPLKRNVSSRVLMGVRMGRNIV